MMPDLIGRNTLLAEIDRTIEIMRKRKETLSMTRKELLAVPKRKYGETLTSVRGVWVIPSRRKHESGWATMDLVAETPEGLVGFGECDKCQATNITYTDRTGERREGE